MIDPYAYSISVRRGEFDGEICFEARIAELPHVAEYADSYDEAYQLAIDTIETTADMLAEQGRQMPAPKVVDSDYSGRVTLRLPKSLHRALAVQADDEGMSLNSMLVTVLAAYRGFGAAMEHGASQWQTVNDKEKPVKSSSSQGTNIVSLSNRQYTADNVSGWS